MSVTSKILKQIEALKNSQAFLNGMVTILDPTEQLAQLETMDQNLPLYGQGVVIKDNVSTKGILTTASSKILGNYVPVYDAHIVDQLRAAGAIILGKSTLDELAMGGTGLTPSQGPTKNPYDLERIAGGSSSGSAAITGAGIVDFAIGSDTGDSVRKPAAYCGVVGVKPTYGRISRYGVIPYASSLDHVGYFTQDVRQSALMLEVLAGRDDRDLTSSNLPVDKYTEITGNLNGKKLAILKNVMDDIKDPKLIEIFSQTVEKLKEAGVIISEVTLDQELMDALFAVYYTIANCEATANHANLDGIRFGVRHEGETLVDTIKKSRADGFGPLVKRRFVVGSYGLEDENQEEVFRKAQKVRRMIVDDLARNMADVDGLIVLAAPEIAPKIEDVLNNKKTNSSIVAQNHMVLANFSGYPSMTVPIGFENDLPIGLNLTTKPFTEKEMFDISLGIEELMDFDVQRKERATSWATK